MENVEGKKWNYFTLIDLKSCFCNYRWSHEKECILFTHYKTLWYNSSHATKCVEVEHEEKSLDYRALMNVVNQCEADSPVMSMSAKVPEYILRSVNGCVDVKPLARSNDQGTLMNSHDYQRENLPLRHASLQVLKMNSSLYPR